MMEQKVDSLQRSVDSLSERLEWFINKKYPTGEGDENTERGNWTGKFDFILSCLGYAVGLGNVWRFPYLCYSNGGGAFLIPYVIMLFCVGMPIFFLELSLGQFSSRGPIRCWGFARAFSGVGLAMVIISFLVAIYYNMILAWALYYFFASFTSKLPWETCDHDWASKFCDKLFNETIAANCTGYGYQANSNGVCYNGTQVLGLWNSTIAKANDIKRRSPSEDYLENYVLKASKGFEDYGTPDWKLVLALLGAWIIVFLCLIKGIKSSGRVVYFTATFPYVILVILLIRGLTLPGYSEGIKFYMLPDYEKLTDSKVWKDAAVQIFFSLSASWGGLIALASYNKFHNNCLRDAIIVSLGNCMTSVFAGFVIFSFLGYLAHELQTEVKDVVDSGIGLAFTVYPAAVTSLPLPPLWSALFFFMLIILGLDSQFVLVETVLTSVMDMWPNKLKGKKSFVLLVLCAVLFVLGLSMTCPGGRHMLTLLDTYSGGWNVLVIALCECFSVMYFYGFRRFKEDIRVMIGDMPLLCPWTCCAWYWAATWGFITPALVTFVLIFNWVDWSSTTSAGYTFPVWAEVLGFLTTVGTILIIIVVAVLRTCICNKRHSQQDICCRPSRYWGPALVKHRALVKHVPDFIVDPWGDQEMQQVPPMEGEVQPQDIKVHM